MKVLPLADPGKPIYAVASTATWHIKVGFPTKDKQLSFAPG